MNEIDNSTVTGTVYKLSPEAKEFVNNHILHTPSMFFDTNGIVSIICVECSEIYVTAINIPNTEV